MFRLVLMTKWAYLCTPRCADRSENVLPEGYPLQLAIRLWPIFEATTFAAASNGYPTGLVRREKHLVTLSGHDCGNFFLTCATSYVECLSLHLFPVPLGVVLHPPASAVGRQSSGGRGRSCVLR